MPLSWNEIKHRALAFSQEWQREQNEEAESKSFWDGFFHIFGISRRRIAVFEKRITKQDGKQGYIDLLWKGVILVEHKSRGKSLEKAYNQAKDYFPGLKEHELPKYILVSDFARFRLYNLETGTEHEFLIENLVQHIALFGFIAGYEQRVYKEQDPVNIEAAERMGKLHDALKDSGYSGHNLEVYLVRLLFCLFAEDTGIFQRTQFQEYIDLQTKEDGSDLGMHLHTIFEILNTPVKERYKTLDESLKIFPYVNGQLFEERLSVAAFNSNMRNLLLHACSLDWSKISPAIFGSMFQSVMNPIERRNFGAHYTSERNIQKVIQPLFLDSLYQEFEKAKGSNARLMAFHQKLASLYFLDPACGCGNFLIISYRELRQLEILVLKELHATGQGFLDISQLIKVDVNQFAGIEYDEFPARIAEVAMWLIDHQMNMEVSAIFGQYFERLPLKNSAKIVHANALTTDWEEIVISLFSQKKDYSPPSPPKGGEVKVPPPLLGGLGGDLTSTLLPLEEAGGNLTSTLSPLERVGGNLTSSSYPLGRQGGDKLASWLAFNKQISVYILGNPPFIGKHLQTKTQKQEIEAIFSHTKDAGVLDYVSAWYLKAAQYIQDTQIKVAFVSTNSIAQGEQVGILWGELFRNYEVKIHFAHQAFKWSNEAKGNAAVHCVIVGFAAFDTNEKVIFQYEEATDEPIAKKVKNISPYLIEGNDIFVVKRNTPICNVSEMIYGSKATDGGNLFLTEEEKNQYLAKEPQGEKYIKVFQGSEEYINNIKRYCFWLVNANPNDLKKMPILLGKIKAVKEMRLASSKIPTQNLATYPTLFGEIRQPSTDYLIIPRVSSENRKYIPMGFLSSEVIVGDSAFALPNASLYLFGILTSIMHTTWVKYVCGRLKSDFRYSNTIVYNNFPFPFTVSESQRKKIEEAAQKVLDIRAQHKETSLAVLYDNLTMPPELAKAHQNLDKAIDACYRPQPFTSEQNRIEFLFNLYEQYSEPLFKEEKKKKGKGKK